MIKYEENQENGKDRKTLKCDENTVFFKGFKDMIKVLFVCHGSILKNPGKAHRINDCTAQWGAYYTTTTPFLKEPWNDNYQYKIDFEKIIKRRLPFMKRTAAF